MSEGLTFVAIGFRAPVDQGVYDADYRFDGEWSAWFLPKYPGQPEMVLDPLGNHWPTLEAAMDACRKHHALRTGRVSMAVAGPVGVDADGGAV